MLEKELISYKAIIATAAGHENIAVKMENIKQNLQNLPNFVQSS